MYSPEQDCGWMIPNLPIIELMVLIHIDKYGFGDETAPANLALRQDQYNVIKHRLHHKAAWINFLQKKMVHGSVFCNGLGDVLVAKSCPSCRTLPCDQSYLAVVVTCLGCLKENDKLPADLGLDMSETAFETQGDNMSTMAFLAMSKSKTHPSLTLIS